MLYPVAHVQKGCPCILSFTLYPITMNKSWANS